MRGRPRAIRILLGAAAALVAGAALFLLARGDLPPLEPRPALGAPDVDAPSRLRAALEPEARTHEGLSGVAPVPGGAEAFAARVLLADSADLTLDAQYYIWRDDISGLLLLESLLRAADRGVRVRLLLDDVGTSGMDATLAAADAHPNLEVRLFNPFAQRRFRWLAWAADFPRLNHRMHNKSFTVDGAATLLGGRNVGDEYFGVDEGFQFVDLDVLAVGPVAAEVERDFERYWSSASAWPVSRLVPRGDEVSLARLRERTRGIGASGGARDYLAALGRSETVRRILDRALEFEWTTTRLVSDDPAKALGGMPRRTPRELQRDFVGEPGRELQVVSSYFVPTGRGVEFFSALERAGVEVAVLTNSLAATDVPVVHAGYARHREPLLAAGVELFELKPSAAGSRRPDPERGLGPSSAASLHAKTFAVDRERIYVGSFNFDPRSAHLNTEMGLVIDSPRLAAAVSDRFREGLGGRAWEVRRAPAGGLEWHDPESGETLAKEPGSTLPGRVLVEVLSWLPIDWLL